MATAPESDADEQGEPQVNYYALLGVRFGATYDEISRAYRQKAFKIHPDKNKNRDEEPMKMLNKARDVLSCEVMRARYDEELQATDETAASYNPEPLGWLTQGRPFSENFVKQYEQWLQTKTAEGLGKFFMALQENVHNFLIHDFPTLVSGCNVSGRTKLDYLCPPNSILDSVLNEAVQEMDHDGIQETAENNISTITELIDRSRTNDGKPNVLSYEKGKLPILDLTKASFSELKFLLCLFSEFPEDHSQLNKKELLAYVSEFVPLTTVQPSTAASTKPSKRNCAECMKTVDKKSHLHPLKLPRLGEMSTKKVCQSCLDSNYQKDTNDWADRGIAYFEAGKTHSAMGCFTMALCSSANHFQPMLRLSNSLLSLSPEASLTLLSIIIEEADNPNELLKAHISASTAMKHIADQQGTDWYQKWLLLLSANESLVSANELLCMYMSDFNFEVPELTKKKEEIYSSFQEIVSQKEKDFNMKVEETLLELEKHWHVRNWKLFLTTVLAERDAQLSSVQSPRDYIIEALEQFLDANLKKQFVDQMYNEDKYPLIFFRGVMKLSHEKHTEGLAYVEQAAWNACGGDSEWLTDAIIEVIIFLLPTKSDMILPIQEIMKLCETIKTSSCQVTTTSNLPLLYTLEELLPSSKIYWPEFTATTSCKQGRKFQKAVEKQAAAKKMTEYDAAISYIDFVPACEHPVEVAICFLTAAQWFLKDIQSPAKKPNEMYATKNAVIYCLEHAVIISHMFLHPGMQLYISRLALAILIHTTNIAGRLSTPEESKLALSLLETMVYSSRFCPFWKNMPIVTISEAVLLQIFSAKLHIKFILAMQHLEPGDHTVHLSELRYQIYENDLRGLHSLTDADEARTKAMEEMLSEKGWSMNDVTDVLMSPLSPRTKEGWLIQQLTLGSSLEFSELKGFVLKTGSENPSIELLLETKSFWGNKKVGLFSRSDVDTVLQMDAEDVYPLFFSLDPPSDHQRFHPFQKLRYKPDSLDGTDLLHTLFETDYLLKSFSVGAEVSALSPFRQRSCSDGLTSQLPLHLQEILKPVTERGVSRSHINRFWIQADEIVYDCEQSGSCISFRIGQPKMLIRSHPQFPGVDGSIEDTAFDHDPDSPEAKFAADLTAHYDELCEYFPMFGRLRELVKLQVLAVLIDGVLKTMKEKAEGTGVVVTDAMLCLIHTSIRKNQVAGMKTTLRKVHSRIYSDQNFSANKSLYIDEVVNQMMNLSDYKLSRYEMRKHVSNWVSAWIFTSSEEDHLANYVCSVFPLPTREEIRSQIIKSFADDYKAFQNEVKKLKSAATESNQKGKKVMVVNGSPQQLEHTNQYTCVMVVS